MLDNTKKALAKIKRDLDIIKWFMEYGMHVLIAAYLTVAIVLQFGDFMVNVILLGLTGLFFIVSIVCGRKDLSQKDKTLTKRTKHMLNVSLIVVKAYMLGSILYGMFIATSTVSPISIILTTLLIVCWVISVVVELVRLLFEREKDLLIESVKEDFNLLGIAKNVVHGITQTVVPVVQAVKQGVQAVKQGIQVSQRANKNK